MAILKECHLVAKKTKGEFDSSLLLVDDGCNVSQMVSSMEMGNRLFFIVVGRLSSVF